MMKRLAPTLSRFSKFTKQVFRTAPMLLAAVPALHGQAYNYAAREHVILHAFGTYTYTRPAYAPGNDSGVSYGTDFDLNRHGLFKPGLDIRGTYASGTNANEYTYGGGPRVAFGAARIEPYADFLLSYGRINFNQSTDPNYTSDHNTVYTYGGGADVSITHSWGVRVDVQDERWHLSHLHPPFYPLQASVGVSYRFRAHGAVRTD